MPRRKRSRKHERDAVIFSRQGIRDKNETLAVKKCCEYLLCLMKGRFVLDEETLQMISWIADDPKTEIGDFLLSRIPEDVRDHFEEDLYDDLSNLRSFGGTILRILKKGGDKRLARDFSEFLISFLQTTRKSLPGHTASDLEKSIARLQSTFRLSDLETELCLFLFIADVYEAPEDFFDNHLHANRMQGKELLGKIFEVSAGEINTALLHLQNSLGLIEISYGGDIFTLNNEIKETLINPASDILEKNHLKKVGKNSALPLAYHFIDEAGIRHILALLAAKTETGTHILLFGPPGTGKTSFAQALAAELTDPVYEIVQKEAEENNSKHRRLTLTAAVNSMNRDRGAVFIMDEADNILNTEYSWLIRGETQDKGWLNRLLDRPGLRIIWIVNHIHNIEDSVLRRFAYSIHFKAFNQTQREYLWENVVRHNRCKRFFTATDLRQLAKEFKASAGVIDLCVKKAKEAGYKSRPAMIQAVRQGIKAHRVLSAGGEPPPEQKTGDPDYSLDGLNISTNIEEVLFQAERFNEYLQSAAQDTAYSFNLLLHGPPGSGKSAFARYLAEYLDRELLDRRLSDLLNPYVGMTERHIREAFDQAAAEGAVLLIDEADALLFPRANALRSWEVTQTNELLSNMERFRGLLICTTNRLTGVDTAAVRRFNHKIGFDFLTPSGSWTFYNKMLAPLAAPAPEDHHVLAVKNLHRLTPGDFKIVRDRFAFYRRYDVTHDMLIDALEQEAAVKSAQQGEKPIGF